MKKITYLKSFSFLIALFGVVSFGYGQIVAWEMNGNAGNEPTVNATTLAANLNVPTLSRGSGISSSSLMDAFSSNIFTFGAGNTQANAITNNEYLQFQVSASSSFQVSLSTLDINFRRSGTGPNTFIWRYSTDGVSFTNIGSPISYIINPTNGTGQTQINLSTIPALQNVISGTTITFRLYGWGASGGTGTFAIGRLAGNDLSLGGTVAAAPPCSTIVTWDGASWDALPSSTSVAIIDGDYTGGSFSTCSLLINSGNTLTVSNGSFVEVENDVIVNGEIIVETQGNFVQRGNTGTFTVNTGGASSVNKITAPKADWFYYTYWSSPVTGETIAGAFPDADGDRRFWFNAANFLDTNGDDIDDNNNDWQYALGGDTMIPGVGYASTESRFHFPGATGIASFEGSFNTGDVSVGISNNPANTIASWNFIGNPYPSAIDFDAFYAANSTVVDGAAYFWSQATPHAQSNGGNEQSNFSQNDYATYTVGSGGAAGGGPDIPNQYIPSGQGFFISGIDNNTVTFTNAMRMANGTSNLLFFRNSKKKIVNTQGSRLWVNLTTESGVFNQVLLAYVEDATDENDGLSYDAPKIVSQDYAAILYSSMNSDNKKYVIQGKNIDNLNEDEIINLGFSTTISENTDYKLSVAQIEGDFLTNNTVYLKDNLLDTLHNLSDSDYTFTSEIGEFNKRFEIVFNANALSTEDFDTNADTLKIVELEDDHVKFTAFKTIKTVRIYDLLGRQLYNFKGQSDSKTYKLSNLSSTVYIAKVELSNGATITKKAFKK